jgi:hypothetical protein
VNVSSYASTLLIAPNNCIRLHLADQSLSTQQLIATARHVSKPGLSQTPIHVNLQRTASNRLDILRPNV